MTTTIGATTYEIEINAPDIYLYEILSYDNADRYRAFETEDIVIREGYSCLIDDANDAYDDMCDRLDEPQFTSRRSFQEEYVNDHLSDYVERNKHTAEPIK